MKPHTLDFPPLHCSLDQTLGDYYQDFAPAIQLVESGFHGSVDEHGVALADYGHQGHVPNAIIIAQYAIANLAVLGRGDNTRAQQARVRQAPSGSARSRGTAVRRRAGPGRAHQLRDCRRSG